MSRYDAIQRILGDFGTSIGLDDLQLDEEGYCVIVIDDAVVVNMEWEPLRERLLLYAPVGEPGGDPLESFALLLEANHLGRGTDGATLGLPPDSDVIVLSQYLPAAGLDLAEFTATLERFVATAEQWIARMPYLGTAPPEKGEPTPAETMIRA